jgi:hypothetical protein
MPPGRLMIRFWLTTLYMKATQRSIWQKIMTVIYKAIGFFEKYSDQHLSFTDCVSFVLMKIKKIKRVFTFDHHFQLAGFQIYPKWGAEFTGGTEKGGISRRRTRTDAEK